MWFDPWDLLFSQFAEPGLCANTFLVHTHTHHQQQRADPEEILAEFDKKCIGLERRTAPLSQMLRWQWFSSNCWHHLFPICPQALKLNCLTRCRAAHDVFKDSWV